MDLDGEVNWVE